MEYEKIKADIGVKNNREYRFRCIHVCLFRKKVQLAIQGISADIIYVSLEYQYQA